MSRVLHLRITTPMAVLVDSTTVRGLRAEDESGAFGILPGHEDYLTALPASVLRWHEAGGATRYCALRAGVLTVRQGSLSPASATEGRLTDGPVTQGTIAEGAVAEGTLPGGTVTGGTVVAVSCREGILGDDLDDLVARIAAFRRQETDADRSARIEQARLHSRAVRQIIRYLRPDRPGAFDHPPQVSGGSGGHR